MCARACTSVCVGGDDREVEGKRGTNVENERGLEIGERGISVEELFTVMMKEQRLH